MKQGYFSMVLHAHLPYVRHIEDDRLEERWLFEAITETYIPLLWAIEESELQGGLTLSFSPPLMEMLSDPLIQTRYQHYLEKTKELIAKEENMMNDDEKIVNTIQFYKHRYQKITETFLRWDKNILNGYVYFDQKRVITCITSSATHTFLPYLQTHEGLRAQIVNSIDCFKKYFGRRPLGFWLPECAFSPGIDRVLFEEGVQYTFVDEHTLRTSDPTPNKGNGAPVYSPHGVALFGRNDELSSKVWSSIIGYPGDHDYREFYRDIAYQRDWEYIEPFVHKDGIRVDTGLKYNRITGDEEEKDLYVREWAQVKVKQHGEAFIEEVKTKVDEYGDQCYPPYIMMTPFDAELFGHWWFEGTDWIKYLLKHGSEQFEFITPEEYVLRHYRDLETVHACFSTWGRNGYGDVWLNENNSWMYRHLHYMEKDIIEIMALYKNQTELEQRALKQMLREWMLASSSDWAFIIDGDSATNYAINRFREHLFRYEKLKELLTDGQLTEQWVTEFEQEYPFLEYVTMHTMLSSHDQVIQTQIEPVQANHNQLTILMLSWEFPPMMVGGLSRHVFDLSRALVKQGHTIHVLTAHVDGYPTYEQNQGIHVHRLQGLQPHAEEFFHWVGSLNTAMSDYGKKLAKTINFDVIHAHDWLVSVAAKGLKQQLSTPLVATIHATEHGRNDGIKTELQYEINQKEWELTYEAERVVVCSEYMKHEVSSIFSLPTDKLEMIPNGVDPDLIKGEPTETWYEPYGNHDDIYIFSVGRVVKEKGFQTIIEAAPKIIEVFGNVRFLIAGKGPMLAEYQRIVHEVGLEDHVQFIGFVSDQHRNELLNACDIALFPSHYEPFGIVALEGMVAGKPTIVSDTGGLASIVRHRENGLKVLPADADSLAVQVISLLEEPRLAKAIAQTGKQEAESIFNWDNIARETNEVFKKTKTRQKSVQLIGGI